MVGNETREEVDHKIPRAAMSGMFNLLSILELVIDGFDDAPLPESDLQLRSSGALLGVDTETKNLVGSGTEGASNDLP